jgi:ribosomal protein S18 acetylase RimI-like enzyme
MTEDELTAFVRRRFGDYLADRGTTGQSPDEARARAEAEWSVYFPGGRPAAGHRLYRVVDGESPAGTLWLGPAPDEQPGTAWIYYVEVDQELRGRGHGKATMLLAEQEAAAHGDRKLALNVFGGNMAARHLYESVGYRATAINMVKRIPSAG